MIDLNMFNPEKSAQSPREHYQRMLAMAEAKLATLKDNPFGTDEKIVAGWQKERNDSLARAAQYIVQLVGKSGTQELRDAVAPESLKDVLLRGGAGYPALMMIGEGQEELGVLVKQREREMEEVGKLVEGFTDSNVISVLERLWKKTQEAEAALLPFEKKDIWTKLDAGYYSSAETKFLEALVNARAACKNYGEMLKKKK
ncbi:MAG: hypothetical protein WC551_05905 [Patescibacteria group bacterium]